MAFSISQLRGGGWGILKIHVSFTVIIFFNLLFLGHLLAGGLLLHEEVAVAGGPPWPVLLRPREAQERGGGRADASPPPVRARAGGVRKAGR